MVFVNTYFVYKPSSFFERIEHFYISHKSCLFSRVTEIAMLIVGAHLTQDVLLYVDRSLSRISCCNLTSKLMSLNSRDFIDFDQDRKKAFLIVNFLSVAIVAYIHIRLFNENLLSRSVFLKSSSVICSFIVLKSFIESGIGSLYLKFNDFIFEQIATSFLEFYSVFFSYYSPYRGLRPLVDLLRLQFIDLDHDKIISCIIRLTAIVVLDGSQYFSDSGKSVLLGLLKAITSGSLNVLYSKEILIGCLSLYAGFRCAVFGKELLSLSVLKSDFGPLHLHIKNALETLSKGSFFEITVLRELEKIFFPKFANLDLKLGDLNLFLNTINLLQVLYPYFRSHNLERLTMDIFALWESTGFVNRRSNENLLVNLSTLSEKPYTIFLSLRDKIISLNGSLPKIVLTNIGFSPLDAGGVFRFFITNVFNALFGKNVSHAEKSLYKTYVDTDNNCMKIPYVDNDSQKSFWNFLGDLFYKAYINKGRSFTVGLHFSPKLFLGLEHLIKLNNDHFSDGESLRIDLYKLLFCDREILESINKLLRGEDLDLKEKSHLLHVFFPDISYYFCDDSSEDIINNLIIALSSENILYAFNNLIDKQASENDRKILVDFLQPSSDRPLIFQNGNVNEDDFESIKSMLKARKSSFTASDLNDFFRFNLRRVTDEAPYKGMINGIIEVYLGMYQASLKQSGEKVILIESLDLNQTIQGKLDWDIVKSSLDYSQLSYDNPIRGLLSNWLDRASLEDLRDLIIAVTGGASLAQNDKILIAFDTNPRKMIPEASTCSKQIKFFSCDADSFDKNMRLLLDHKHEFGLR